jgi:hypothetical protein
MSPPVPVVFALAQIPFAREPRVQRPPGLPCALDLSRGICWQSSGECVARTRKCVGSLSVAGVRCASFSSDKRQSHLRGDEIIRCGGLSESVPSGAALTPYGEEARSAFSERCFASPGEPCGRDVSPRHREKRVMRSFATDRIEAKEVAMNRVWLFLPITFLAIDPAVAADLSVPARARAAQIYAAQIYNVARGPLGACRIYIQGRYSACEVTTEPVCQRLSEVWRKPRYAVASRRWFALPQGLAWDMPPC